MPSLSTLQQRMADLKSKHDHKIKSDDRTPTPLSTFLTIYTKANHACYIDYMEGARYLIDYLSPIELPPIPDKVTPVPRLLHGYELTELAGHLATDSYNLKEVRHIETCIFNVLSGVSE